MNITTFRGERQAFGRPGIEPRWTHGNKEGVGTAYTASSRIWFTLWNGILTEVYYPTVDRPQLRDLQHLISSVLTALGIAFVDIPILTAQQVPIRFTFFWTISGRWEGRNYEVTVRDQE